ncbi:MAG: HAD-IIB family hydrolase [Opitutae bacterium]|nr:HAD-IIB family hydrolase [Opitutae bacterium]
MSIFKPDPQIPPRVLATDLDGTFIPLPGNADNLAALETFRHARASLEFGLVFATGRHFESVLEALRQYALPEPDWIVCDVGTSIHHRQAESFVLFEPFETHLAKNTRGGDRTAVEALLADLDGLALQSPERQQRFKISYVSSAAAAESLAALANQRLEQARLPYACLASLDPFHGKGLLDVLPAGASKAAALIWLATHADFTPDEVVFAGDSDNDFAALTCGFRAIVVANARGDLAGEARCELARRGLEHRLFQATLSATSGVLEGCRRFGLLPA